MIEKVNIEMHSFYNPRYAVICKKILVKKYKLKWYDLQIKYINELYVIFIHN